MLDTIFLRIAKSAILNKFDKQHNIERNKLLEKHPFLNRDGAAFVTLKYEHQLRGCIGSIIAHRKLLDDVIHNAESSAFSDPRFNPLSSDELSHLELEVSVLSEPKILEYTDFEDLVKKIRPNIDGLILQHGSHQGTFLPQVWEQLPTPKEFLEHLSYKAGSNPSIYKENPTIYTYQVDAIEERFDEILPL
jgi:AmmeMemoRadiSam system protein A